MAGILSGLDQLGLGGIGGDNLFDSPDSNVAAEQSAVAKSAGLQEADFVYDKVYKCPVCDKEFKSKTAKTGKAKLIGTDLDLRPKHEGVDMTKYDAVACPHCGYAALSRYFGMLTDTQAKKIREDISKSYKGVVLDGAIYSYDDALLRYKLTLANAIVKQAKSSEKAYICLKSAWLLRGKSEELAGGKTDASSSMVTSQEELKKAEQEYLKNALEGFIAARQSEGFPICGMDETTVDYLIAALAIGFGQLDVASRLVSNIIASQQTNARMKDKARDLKDIILEMRKG